mgnify:CR=1 FL=1
MFNVQITYKSGKVEVAQIMIAEYCAALESLAGENRVTGIKILSVE